MSKHEKEKKKNRVLILSLSISIIMILIVIIGAAYARYVTKKKGNATAQVSRVICNMDVVSSADDKTIVHPYCTVTLNNYDVEEVDGVSTNKVTEADVAFTVTVTPKTENFVIPQYYWVDSNDTIIANNTDLTGSFTIEGPQTKTYKVVFLNSGEEDMTALVDFNLNAVQSKN